MEMEHNFTVPAPVDTVWQALLDPERVAPCFPGATITSASGDEFAGTVKVRLGPVSLQYKGSGKFTDKDTSAHRAVIEASGKDARGNGTASATVTTTLSGNGDSTAVKVATDLQVTGRPAQFGRGMLSDVGGKIIGQFADCLADRLAPDQQAAAAAPEPEPSTPAPEDAAGAAAPVAAERPSPRPVSDEIDLLNTAGTPVLKRVAPIAAGVALLLVILGIRRRRRRR